MMIAVFVIVAVMYARATPFFEAPDEAAHFLYVHNLLETGELPTLFESRDAIFASQATQRHHPPLYYMAGALLVAWTERDDVDAYLNVNPLAAIGNVTDNNQNVYLHNWRSPGGDTARAIWMLRLFSIALTAGMLWMIYRIGALAFGRRKVGLLAMLLAVSVPTFVFIGASINNDNLVTFFYTAGILWTVQVWNKGEITRRDIVLISLILPGVALSKTNGLTLYGLVYGGLVLGALRGKVGWRGVIGAIVVSGIASVLLAGWWYWRNVDLYGDPFAVEIMRGIWGRGLPPRGWEQISSEAESVWLSFWMILGQFNVRGPGWVYDYVAVITALGAAGIGVYVWRRRQQWDVIVLLVTAMGLVIAALVIATQEVKVSQGRILFPMIGAFAPLLAVGWLNVLPRRFGLWRGGGLLVIPLVLVTLVTPFTVLDEAFPRLEVVEVLPDDVSPINLNAETLFVHGYRFEEDVIAPGDVVHVSIYFSHSHEDNLAIGLGAIDPLTNAVYGGVVTYPGMTFTSQLADDEVYQARLRLRLDGIDEVLSPRRLNLNVGWVAFDGSEIVRNVEWTSPEGESLSSSLVVGGVTLIHPDYEPPSMETDVDVVFGDVIGVEGYTVWETELAPGDVMTVSLLLDYVSPMDNDWTLTVGLVDEQGTLVTQKDGMPLGYPTSAWRAESPFIEVRAITIPEDAPPGAYQLYFGWYDHETLERLPISAENARDNLYWLPETITIRADNSR